MTFNKIIHTSPDDVGIPYSRSRFIALTADLSALFRYPDEKGKKHNSHSR